MLKKQFSVISMSLYVFSQIMETEIGGRKRPRGVLDVCADYFAFKSFIKRPVRMRAKFGLRNLTVKSQGKCTCGHVNTNTVIIRHVFFSHKIVYIFRYTNP